MFEDRFELLRPNRKIEKAITARAALLVNFLKPLGQGFESGFVCEIALMIESRLGEVVPDLVSNGLSREISDRLLHFFAKLVVGFWAAGETDHGYSGRQLAIGGEIVKGGQQLSMSQITGCAENHDAAWLRHGARR